MKPVVFDENTDPSLIRCTIKKSISIFTKVVLYTSYVICSVSILGMGYMASIATYPMLVNAWVSVYQILASIPWYIYCVALALLAIPVYSLLWCMKRDIEQCDWESVAATNTVTVVAVAFAAFAVVFAAVAFAFAAFAVAAFAVVFAGENNHGPTYYVVRFIGAYYNYYKRTRGGE